MKLASRSLSFKKLDVRIDSQVQILTRQIDPKNIKQETRTQVDQFWSAGDALQKQRALLLDRALVAVSLLNSLALNDFHVAFILNVEVVRIDLDVLLKARQTHRR